MRQLARNVVSLYFVRAVGVISAVALFPYIASNVTATEFGIWLLIGSIALVIATSDFGVGTSVVRYVSDALARGDDAETNRVVASTLVFYAAFGVAAAGLLLAAFTVGFGAFNIPETERGTTLLAAGVIAGGTLLVGLPLGTFRQVLVGLHRMDLANAMLLVQVLARVALIVLALEAGFGIVGVVVAEAGAGLIGSVLALILVRRLFTPLSLRHDAMRMSTLRRMASYSLQVFGMSLASVVILQGGTVVIGFLLPVAAVTLYTAAFRIFQVCRDVTGALLQAVAPEASRAAARGDTKALRELLLRGSKFANVVIIALVVPTMLLAEPLLLAWVGPGFVSVAPVVQLLLIGLLVNNNHLVGIGLLTGTGRIGRVFRYHVVWAASSVALSLLLVPIMGLTGVALGMGLPLLVLEPLYVRIACREAGTGVGAFLRQAVLIPYTSALVPAAVTAAVVVVLSPSGFAGLLAVAGVFLALFAAVFVPLGLEDDERRMLGRLLRRSRVATGGQMTASTPDTTVASSSAEEA